MSYEKDGEKYYVVDAHCHFWDASRENWKPGREEYAKGWIDCFYGYHQLAPPETHWDYEKYLKVTPEDFEQDMFVEYSTGQFAKRYERISRARGKTLAEIDALAEADA